MQFTDFSIFSIQVGLRRAVNNNILVFDERAKSGELTSDLISFMKSVNENSENLLYLLFPQAVYKGECIEQDLKKDIPLHSKVWGVELIFGEDLTPHYNKMGTTLPKDDKFIVLGFTKSLHPLLGSC
jgi:hypothetical protein